MDEQHPKFLKQMNENPIKSGSANLASPSTKIILNPYEQIADYRGGVFNFNLQTSLLWMEERGKILFGESLCNSSNGYRSDLQTAGLRYR